MNKPEKRKKISIGVEDFKEIIEKDGYFVDKTLMIRDLFENNAMVTLFTRPRRFGKTLNQTSAPKRARRSTTAASLTDWQSQNAAKRFSPISSSIL